MFENIDSTFFQAVCFFAAGAAFGLCYEALRLLRMLFKHHAAVVFAEDTLFFALCGFVSFIIALWVGIGYFRIYYMAFELLGASLYFLTLGRLINALLRRAVRGIKVLFASACRKVSPKLAALFVPIAVKFKEMFSNIAENVIKPIFNRKKHLKNTDEMLYNSKVHTPVILNKGGESGGVIKAQIRKKT
ncbi:MAG: spore cortex biosynthesis protein YabQ [Bacteroides sp.]|nr:spore cortex biosynthesis protein YabQ [Bacteroides sp.]